MYAVESLKNALRGLRVGRASKAQKPSPSKVPRAVLWIGMTSLLTDLATEMVGSILPAFLFSVLLLPPLVIGLMEGVYQGAAAILRLPGGFWADRFHKHKSVAAWGYGASAIAKLCLVLSMQWGMLAALTGLGLDRIGKAVRTAPRDVLIAHHAQADRMGAAFGLHRAMDAVGALAGPLLAFCIFAWAPENYALLLGISFFCATLGLIVFISRVPGIGRSKDAERIENQKVPQHACEALSWAALVRVLRAQKSYWIFLWCAAALSAGVVSDGLLYLYLQQKYQVPMTWLPLLYSAAAAVFVIAAYPLGHWADTLGPKRLIVAGHGVMMFWYLCIPHVPATMGVVGSVIALGCFYAATDGVLVAQATKLLPSNVSTTGIAFLGAVVGLMRILSSTLFGALWQWQGQAIVFGVFSMVLGLAVVFTAVMWPSPGESSPS